MNYDTTYNYLSVKQAAKYLNISKSLMYKLIEDHRIPFYQLPAYRLKPTDLDDYASSCRVEIIE